MIDKKCEHIINEVDPCTLSAKVKVSRPNPVVPGFWPKYFCYSHLTSTIRASYGQFLVEKVEA